MSVIIKGMKMPERCWDCDLCYDSFYCRPLGIQFSDREDFEPGERRLSDCPLVHVPPHGRLIDADVLSRYKETRTDTKTGRCEDVVSMAAIRNVKTIIPAEEGE